jgi:hypothetical protein
VGFVERRLRLAAIFLDRPELFQVAYENAIGLNAILKTLEIVLQLGCPFFRQRIDHPILVTFDFHHPAVAQVAEVLGNFNLRLAQDGLEMADAQRRAGEQTQDPQPRPVAEALINVNQIHRRSAAGLRAGAARFSDRGFSAFLGETLRLALAENQIESIPRRLGVHHRVLGHDAAIVFHFDFEPVVRENLIADLKDLREAIRAKPVISVRANMSLQQDGVAPACNATAIDEAFGDVTDFGHVGVRRNNVAVRQNKTGESVRMGFEDQAKIGKFHRGFIFLLRNIVKRQLR